MKCIIAGSRSVSDYKTVQKALDMSGFIPDITEVVCGDAKGVDKLGEFWAKKNDIPVHHIPADWKNLDTPGAIVVDGMYGKYNKIAGYQRNSAMAKYADCLIAVIENNSKGTTHMIDIMQKLNKPVYVYEV